MSKNDVARSGSPKRLTPLRIHPDHASRTTTTLGGPTQGNPPDASSPSPVDHEKQHASKTLPIPACHPSMKSDSERGSYRPDMADKIMGEAVRPVSDFAPLLHTPPATTTEE
jgi:hypothetical protein